MSCQWPLRALPHALRESNPSLALALEDVVDLFQAAASCLREEKIHKGEECCVDDGPCIGIISRRSAIGRVDKVSLRLGRKDRTYTQCRISTLGGGDLWA
jgi:hypothetical protein